MSESVFMTNKAVTVCEGSGLMDLCEIVFYA